MTSIRNAIASASVIAGLLTSSMASAAPLTPVAASQASNAWLTLSMLTTTGAAELASTAVAATQPVTSPPTTKTCPDGAVVPIDAPCGPTGYTGPSTPPIPVLLIWLAVLGVDIYILTKNHHHHPVPNSPV